MPRQTRKARKAKTKKITPPAPIEEIPPETVSPVPWNVRQRIRVRCPCCGFLPEEDRILAGPFDLEVKLQTFGGSMPSSTGEMKDRPGYMNYEDIPELLSKWRPIIIEKLKAALEQLEE